MSIETKHLANPQDLNRYAYVANNPLKYVDPDGQEKVKVVIETFIPAPDVTVMGTTFSGDYDNKGNRVEGSYRTQQVIIVETDPSKNGGNVLYEKTRDTGPSFQLDKPGGKPIDTKEASGETLQAEVSRNQYGVHINASGNERNPLITSPGITGEYSVHLQSGGPEGRLRVGLAVEHDPFPAHRITVTRPESGNTTTEVYLFDPRSKGYTPLSLNPLADNERKAKVVFIEPGKKQ